MLAYTGDDLCGFTLDVLISLSKFSVRLEHHYCAKAISNAKLSMDDHECITNGTYVTRSKIEGAIKRYVDQRPNGTYFVLFGPQGAGKSTAVMKVLENRSGVILISASNVATKTDVINALSDKIIGCKGVPSAQEKCNAVLKRCSVTPVIVFEVKRGGAQDYLKGVEAVRSLAKAHAVVCKCIIVLSDPSAVFAFGKDKFREKYLCAEELSYDEAKAMLTNVFKKRGLSVISDADMEFLFKSIGTNPLQLNEFVTSRGDMSVKEYVESILEKETKVLRNYPHQVILKALKDHPEGVEPVAFIGQMSNGIKLNEARPVVTNDANNVIMYRMDLSPTVYQLQRQSLRTALQRYESPVQQKSWFWFW